MIVRCTVNGSEHHVPVSGSESLLFVLRERLGLPGAKSACEQGECGSCSILLDGRLVCACLVMAVDAEGADIVTVEALSDPDAESVDHPVQRAFVESGAVQCGFCTPGLVVAAAALLDATPHPTTDDIREALAGNICRCTGYGAILRALEGLAASERAPDT
jgi:carbon-monoxide dehydrogenase small subunit